MMILSIQVQVGSQLQAGHASKRWANLNHTNSMAVQLNWLNQPKIKIKSSDLAITRSQASPSTMKTTRTFPSDALSWNIRKSAPYHDHHSPSHCIRPNKYLPQWPTGPANIYTYAMGSAIAKHENINKLVILDFIFSEKKIFLDIYFQQKTNKKILNANHIFFCITVLVSWSILK